MGSIHGVLPRAEHLGSGTKSSSAAGSPSFACSTHKWRSLRVVTTLLWLILEYFRINSGGQNFRAATSRGAILHQELNNMRICCHYNHLYFNKSHWTVVLLTCSPSVYDGFLVTPVGLTWRQLYTSSYVTSVCSHCFSGKIQFAAEIIFPKSAFFFFFPLPSDCNTCSDSTSVWLSSFDWKKNTSSENRCLNSAAP